MEAVLTNLMHLSIPKKYSECFTLQGIPQCMARTDYWLPALFSDFLKRSLLNEKKNKNKKLGE